MNKKRVIFMGTPEFALKPLELIAQNFELLALFCQSDKPKDRSQKIQMPPTKCYVLKHFPDVKIYQPKKIDSQAIEIVQNLSPDLIIVVAYGKILPKEIIKFPCINLHGSILPFHRGASPIQSMILNDDKKLGLTIMRMDEGMDSGDILSIFEMPNDGKITSSELFKILSEEGAKLLLETLLNLENIKPIKQDHTKATFCKKIKKEDGLINFEEDAHKIMLKARAFDTFPGIFLESKLKLFGVNVENTSNSKLSGQILEINKKIKQIKVACKLNTLIISELQAPSKSRIKASDFLNGKGLKVGDILK